MNYAFSKHIIFYLSLTLIVTIGCTNSTSIYNEPYVTLPPIVNSNLTDANNYLLEFNNQITIKQGETYDFIVLQSENHIAFVDLIHFGDTWYIAFRVSDEHVAVEYGNIIICKSRDLKNWVLEQEYQQAGYDLRDPKFIIKDNDLYIYFHSTTIRPYGQIRNDYISKYNPLNESWSVANLINKNTNEKSWFWRLTVNNDTVYTLAYLNGIPLKLYKSSDLLNFKESHVVNIPGDGSESTIRFRNDTAYALIRRASGGAYLGVSHINDLVSWKSIVEYLDNIGGPNFLIYKDHLLLSGRIDGKTRLLSFSLNEKTKKGIKVFPGGMKETGYPGMFIKDDFLYMAYYTGVEDGFAILFSIVSLKEVIKDI